jgi:hypothetical protein
MIEIGCTIFLRSLPLAQLQNRAFFLAHIKQKPKGHNAKWMPIITSMSLEKMW